jgi:hypothetical protein
MLLHPFGNRQSSFHPKKRKYYLMKLIFAELYSKITDPAKTGTGSDCIEDLFISFAILLLLAANPVLMRI